jgi:hypothetical protein
VRRVAILGPAGAGKSRLARKLAVALELPVVHLDRLYWKPGWVATPEPEWEAVQRRELERDSWIADGLQEGRVGLPDHWLDAADTIVFIDAPPLLCVWRVIRRRLSSEAGPAMPTDCKPAPFYRALPKFLRLLLLYRRTVRPDVLADLARRRHRQQVAILRSDEDLRKFLAAVKAQRAPLGESLFT